MVAGLLFSCRIHSLYSQCEFELAQGESMQIQYRYKDAQLDHKLAQGEVKPQEIFKVFMGSQELKEEWASKPVIGVYTHTLPGKLIFKPLLAFRPEVIYRAQTNDNCQFEFSIPYQHKQAPELLAIYPPTDTVPENLLKIYVTFTKPMQEGEVYERVRVFSDSGEEIKAPFVPLRPELWSDDNRTITLWLDPGRIKRDLLSRQTHGAVLLAGSSVKILIDSSWKDAQGIPLGKTTVKHWIVGSGDRTSPKVSNWTVNSPAAGTRQAVEVSFGEYMDYASTHDALVILGQDDRVVKGRSHLSPDHRKWTFIPENIWKEENYTLEIRATVEDLAGNNLKRLFDRDLKSDLVYSAIDYHRIALSINP